jgi:hypothetical protein
MQRDGLSNWQIKFDCAIKMPIFIAFLMALPLYQGRQAELDLSIPDQRALLGAAFGQEFTCASEPDIASS